MTARSPRVATWLLVRFSSGPHGEAIAGDLLEQYTTRRSRVWYWRQVLSAISVDIVSTVRDHKWRTVLAIALGWVAYVATSFPTTWLVHKLRLITQVWLSDIDTEWFLWTLRAESTLIIAMVCVAIGWAVAKAGQRSAPAAVCLLAMTLMIFELGMIALFFANSSEPSRSLSTAELFTSALLVLSRPAGILLGGLFGMRPGAQPTSAGTRLGSS
jgi:hypothetical protein